MIHIPEVETAGLRMLLQFYQRLYGEGDNVVRTCRCNTIKYPAVSDDNVMCFAHRWLDHRERCLNRLIDDKLTRPLPNGRLIKQIAQSIDSTLLKEIVEGLPKGFYTYLKGNPLQVEPEFVAFEVASPLKVSLLYVNSVHNNYEVEKTLHSVEHIPVFTTTKKLIDMEFSRDEAQSTAVEEILLYAPILIIADSGDARMSFDTITEPIYSRQYGTVMRFERDNGY
jgi:hypothetical protein